MKKSELYYLAQIAVTECESFNAETKLAILPELMDAESLARYREKQEEQEEKEEAK